MDTLTQKIKPIKLLILDIDGTLATPMLYYTEAGIALKAFSVHDGLGIKLLQQSGVEVAIITVKQSPIITKRMQDLSITHVYQNQSDKVKAYEHLKETLHLEDQQIAYVGDDLPDLPVMRRVGLSITLSNAPTLMHRYADHVTKAKGGKGAVREIAEWIMQVQGTYDQIIQPYLDR